MPGNHECPVCGDVLDSERELEEHALEEHERNLNNNR